MNKIAKIRIRRPQSLNYTQMRHTCTIVISGLTRPLSIGAIAVDNQFNDIRDHRHSVSQASVFYRRCNSAASAALG